MRFFLAITTVLLFAGCEPPTTFRGEATVPGGRPTCESRCAQYGMKLVGMVSMGESYTDGCICAVPEAAPGAAPAAVVGAAPAVVGVVMQARRAEQQRRQAALSHH
jgi:hypothetical protein